MLRIQSKNRHKFEHELNNYGKVFFFDRKLYSKVLKEALLLLFLALNHKQKIFKNKKYAREQKIFLSLSGLFWPYIALYDLLWSFMVPCVALIFAILWLYFALSVFRSHRLNLDIERHLFFCSTVGSRKLDE